MSSKGRKAASWAAVPVEGEEAAVSRHLGWAVRLAFHVAQKIRVNVRHHEDEIRSEAHLAVLRAVRKFARDARSGDKVEAWIAAAVSLIVRAYRSQKVNRSHLRGERARRARLETVCRSNECLDEHALARPGPQSDREEARQLEEAMSSPLLDCLSDGQRRLFLEVEVLGWSQRDIGRRDGLAPQTVNERMRAVRKKLGIE